MIHWLWALAAFVVGVAFGIFVIAFFDIAKREDERPKKWWEQ